MTSILGRLADAVDGGSTGNIAVSIDGVLYMQRVDARAASYGIMHHVLATSPLAQTTPRSEIGAIELDRTFEERERYRERDRFEAARVEKPGEPLGDSGPRHAAARFPSPEPADATAR